MRTRDATDAATAFKLQAQDPSFYSGLRYIHSVNGGAGAIMYARRDHGFHNCEEQGLS